MLSRRALLISLLRTFVQVRFAPFKAAVQAVKIVGSCKLCVTGLCKLNEISIGKTASNVVTYSDHRKFACSGI
jgi:hypothetical protein